MQEKITTTIYGKISAINYEKRSMLVKSNDKNPIEYPLYWEEVLDVVCKKQKQGYRVRVIAVTNPAEENPITRIKEIVYDDSYKGKRGDAYADPVKDKSILLQSCLRTGASVLMCTTTPDTLDFDAAMDMLIGRAIKDAATLTAEAKKP